MQHPDEGTIHSWLDRALGADEAARVEAHVAQCPRCAAAVAEARGFVAASSRILTALDHVPRGVVPAARQVKWHNRAVWRAAAAVLIVATGSIAVFRNSGSNSAPEYSSIEEPDPNPTPKPAPPVIVRANPARITGVRGQPNASISEKRGVVTGGVTAGDKVAASENAPVAVATPRALVQSRVAGVVAMDAANQVSEQQRHAAEPEPLKVVGTPGRIGVNVTLYEIAPGDTVTLTESMTIRIRGATMRATAAPIALQATGKSAAAPSKTRADAAAITSTAAESQRAAGVSSSAPAVSAPASTSQVGMANTLHTITWTDSTTGNTLTLTGRMPEARLQEIKIRIERERATAAAGKKTP